MNMKQLQYVLVLSQAGSFSKAADILNISQPSLSQYIKKIEAQVGVELFDRLNGNVRLTDAGMVYVDIGRQILDLEHQMENRLSDLANNKSGTVKLGISPYRSFHMIPDILKKFNQLFPNVTLIVTEKSGSDLIDAAEHGDFDLCIIALPIDSPNFDYEIISSEELLVAVNIHSDLYNRLSLNSRKTDNRIYPVIDITLVNGADFAVLNNMMPMYHFTEKALTEFNVTVNKKIEVNSIEALCSVVRSEVCASFVPSGVANPDSNDIQFFSLAQDLHLRDIAVIYRKNQYLSEPIKQLIQILHHL